MDTDSKPVGPSMAGAALDAKPKKKPRGPSMKKKAIYIQSRLCFHEVPRHTIKAKEYSIADIESVYKTPKDRALADPDNSMGEDRDDEEEEEKETYLYEVNPDFDSAVYAERALALYERISEKAAAMRQEGLDFDKVTKQVDRLHKVSNGGTGRKPRKPKPCRSKIPQRMQDYIRDVMSSTCEIMSTTRMIALLRAKFPNEETYPK